MSLAKTLPDSNKPHENNERVTILRAAHGREDGHTFETQAAYIIGAGGARLIAGRSITRVAFGALTRNAEAHERATSNVRQFPQRPRPTSPTGEKVRAAA